MAILHGKSANIYWDSQTTDTLVAEGQSWTLDVTREVAEATAMQATWKTYWTGFQDWTVVVNCLLPIAGSSIPLEGDGTPLSIGDQTTARLELYLVWDTVTPAYTTLYGEAFVSGIVYGATVNGIATVTYTFQGSGQIVWAASAGVRP